MFALYCPRRVRGSSLGRSSIKLVAWDFVGSWLATVGEDDEGGVLLDELGAWLEDDFDTGCAGEVEQGALEVGGEEDGQEQG